jgi:hypothetical protein
MGFWAKSIVGFATNLHVGSLQSSMTLANWNRCAQTMFDVMV